MQDRYLDIHEVATMFRVSGSAIMKRVKNGSFPKPITGKKEKSLWLREHIEEWERDSSPFEDTERINWAIPWSVGRATAAASIFTNAKNTARAIMARKAINPKPTSTVYADVGIKNVILFFELS